MFVKKEKIWFWCFTGIFVFRLAYNKLRKWNLDNYTNISDGSLWVFCFTNYKQKHHLQRIRIFGGSILL